MKTYRPLPASVTINKSDIEGLGLFAVEDIKANINLGMIHYYTDNEILRTPLGGFINHSDKPNCTKIAVGNTAYIVTNRHIFGNEELTIKYDLYKI